MKGNQILFFRLSLSLFLLLFRLTTAPYSLVNNNTTTLTEQRMREELERKKFASSIIPDYFELIEY